MFQQIIVPLDGSEDATLAVGPASALAQRLGVPMHVFSLHKPDDDPEEAHDALVAQLGPTGDVPRVVEVAPIRKSVAEDIRELAARNAPSLIVMASHGRGRSAAVIGSVANDIGIEFIENDDAGGYGVRWRDHQPAGTELGTRKAGWKLGGLVYFAPDDPAVFVPKRVGIGQTVNMARGAAWAVTRRADRRRSARSSST